jgi:hypothetical protein
VDSNRRTPFNGLLWIMVMYYGFFGGGCYLGARVITKAAAEANTFLELFALAGTVLCAYMVFAGVRAHVRSYRRNRG